MSDTATTPAPGWYSDPDYANTQRYWNGLVWTENRHPPLPTPVVKEREAGGLVFLGYVTAVLLPIVGFVLGVVMLIRGKQMGHGLAVLLISVAIAIVGCQVALNQANKDLDRIGRFK